MSSLISNSLAQDWLGQFTIADHPVASQLLKSLRLISASKAETGIRERLDQVIQTNTGPIALFPIRKNNPNRYGSEDRIGHILQSLANQYRNVVFVEPTVEKMRQQRFKHIIHVDDIIGSGKRIETFWESVTPSEKSWLSFKFCKLWIVTYAQNTDSVDRIRSKNPYLKKATFLSAMELSGSPELWDDRIIELCSKYGQLTYARRFSTGFQGVPTNLIFEWNAPNNSPAILWSAGSQWKPLFPGRAIPTELRSFFLEHDPRGDNVEILWNKGQQNLALDLIDEIEDGQSPSSSNLLIILGLLAKGFKASTLHKLLLLERAEIARLILYGQEAGFINSQKKINDFGKDLLIRKRKKTLSKEKIVLSNQNAINFYPKKYKGFQRV